jgi:hypothetical protein
MRNLGPFNTLKEAADRAGKIASSGYGLRYVVYEAGEYHVADDVDLDTFFVGVRDQDIRYCTAD